MSAADTDGDVATSKALTKRRHLRQLQHKQHRSSYANDLDRWPPQGSVRGWILAAEKGVGVGREQRRMFFHQVTLLTLLS